MKEIIDQLDDPAGWVTNDPSVTVTKNEVPQYIAGLGNEGSLIIRFPGNIGDYAEKTLTNPVDVTLLDRLVFSDWAQRSQVDKSGAVDPSQISYKLWINDTDYFQLPAGKVFEECTFNISQVTTITKIKIESKTALEEGLIVSHMVSSTDELPLDLFQATKEHLDYYINRKYASAIVIGKASPRVGDKAVFITSGLRNFVTTGSCIRISDGNNEEIHQVDEDNNNTWSFTALFGGKDIINTYTDADIFLYIPVVFGTAKKEIVLPGIAIWGFTPEPVERFGKIEENFDSYQDTSVSSKGITQFQDHLIGCHCESHSSQVSILAIISQLVRNHIARMVLWVNGYRFYIRYDGSPSYTEPDGSTDQIEYIAWQFRVEIAEDISDRQQLTLQKISDIQTDVRRV